KWIINEWKHFGDEFEMVQDVDKYISMEEELLQEILQDAEAEFAILDGNYMPSFFPQEYSEDQSPIMMDLDEIDPDSYRTYEFDIRMFEDMNCFACQSHRFLPSDDSKAICCPNCEFSLNNE
ncbi:7422_t:CDS:2, partial [Acaulospora colombiana]